MGSSLKLGRKSPHPDDAAHPRLRLGQFLTGTPLPATPAIVDWASHVPSWPMYGNDKWGDCVWAMIGHAIEVFTTYGSGTTVKVTDADVLKGYSDVTGFNPNDPSTDQGTVIQDALGYWRKTGVGGHKILAFAQVDHTNPAEVAAALNLFGELLVGINFPASAMTQFDKGQPWDVVARDGGIDGGHAINQVYDAATGRLKVVTWAKVQDVTPAFWSKYVEECWAPISNEWLDAAGHSPAGLDLYGLGQAFQTLTKEPNPFPAPSPQPTPSPTPGPAPQPSPVVDDADRALASAVKTWAAGRHSGATVPVAKAFETWLTAKEL